MAPILHFDKNPGAKKYNFLVMMQSEKDLDKTVKETEFFCPMVIKGLMSDVNEETTISEEKC